MIKFRNPIENRSEIINNRLENKHFEADLIVSRRGDKSCFLTIIDRKSRLLKAKKLPNKKPSTIIKELKVFCEELGIKSITFDNGIEFKNHYELRELGVETYFCNPYSSWEKGSIENANRIIRRFSPKKSYLNQCVNEDLQRIVEKINNIPRKIINFKTPNEIYFGF